MSKKTKTARPRATPVLLVLGLSGVGKSALGKQVAAKLDFLHIEIDRWPDGDGIDLEGLRAEWTAFYDRGDATDFASAVRARAVDAAGAIVTFPSRLTFRPALISAAERATLTIVVLAGTEQECRQAFVERGQRERALGAAFWNEQNAGLHAEFAKPQYAPFRVPAFEGGKLRAQAAILADVRKRAASP